jgi:hypothetical protein
MRPIVRLDGIGAILCSIIARRIASAPESPRSLFASSPRSLKTSSSVAVLVRLAGFGAPAARSVQLTRSSLVVEARPTHRRTVWRLTRNSRATLRKEFPRRTACTIDRRCCSMEFCAHGLSHFFAQHINLSKPPMKPGYGI